jgi:hypothetical protein
MAAIKLRQRLLWLLGIRHRWMDVRAGDGGRYQECSSCGKDRFDDAPPRGGLPPVVAGGGF